MLKPIVFPIVFPFFEKRKVTPIPCVFPFYRENSHITYNILINKSANPNTICTRYGTSIPNSQNRFQRLPVSVISHLQNTFRKNIFHIKYPTNTPVKFNITSSISVPRHKKSCEHSIRTENIMPISPTKYHFRSFEKNRGKRIPSGTIINIFPKIFSTA